MQTNEHSLVGKTLRNKYYINEVLSADIQGGQGKVYIARDTTTSIEKKYIIKQFAPKYKDTDFLEVGSRLFEQEAVILQRLGSHSQIPQILDYFEENKQFFLVQEWIEGQNLQQELNSKQRLTESETIALLEDVLEVLSFVHQNECIHRDIKPANLIRNKYDRKVYLIDFGAVKEKIRPENINAQGNKTVAIGTFGYMPIEQLNGKPEFCSDIYALGMLVIQAITGIHPQQLELDDRYNPLWQKYLPTSDRNLNSNLLKIIERMVRGNHKERYQSAAEVLTDLQQINLNLETSPESFEPPCDPIISIADNSQAKKSLIPWLLVSLGVIIAVTAGFVSLRNTDKYVTYYNSNYGFKLERPQNWLIQVDDNFINPGVIFLTSQENSEDNFREQVKVSVENLSKPLSLNEYTEQAVNEIKNDNVIIEQPQSTTFANREGRKIIYQGQDGIRRMQIWILKNQKAYIATYTAEEKKFDKFTKQANSIIESVKINK